MNLQMNTRQRMFAKDKNRKTVFKEDKTTKFHLTTEKFGRPIRINLSAGNINDNVVFEKQIAGKI